MARVAHHARVRGSFDHHRDGTRPLSTAVSTRRIRMAERLRAAIRKFTSSSNTRARAAPSPIAFKNAPGHQRPAGVVPVGPRRGPSHEIEIAAGAVSKLPTWKSRVSLKVSGPGSRSNASELRPAWRPAGESRKCFVRHFPVAGVAAGVPYCVCPTGALFRRSRSLCKEVSIGQVFSRTS